jgi:hypothetical protein
MKNALSKFLKTIGGGAAVVLATIAFCACTNTSADFENEVEITVPSTEVPAPAKQTVMVAVPEIVDNIFYEGLHISRAPELDTTANVVVGGDKTASASGTYALTVSLATNTDTHTYVWADGTTATKSLEWKIVNPRDVFEYEIVVNGSNQTITLNGLKPAYSQKNIALERFQLKIPASIDSIPVKAIADGAFKYENITKLTIPSGITEIGEVAFANCEYLTSVILPIGITKIGAYAFQCSGGGNIQIYAMAASKPAQWAETWNYCEFYMPEHAVTWGYRE